MDRTGRSPTEIARALYDALEGGTLGEELAAELFTDDARTIEHPNLLKPNGAVSHRAEMVVRASTGSAILASQRYEVHEAIESRDAVAVRLTWTGTMAKDVGPLRSGQVLKAHVAQFFTLRAGRIATIETYDCYQPIA
jgi:ketosteroid isomerase-like protein